MNIQIPELSLITLIGVSGSGKSTFAKKHFLPTEIISSDFCRGLVSDDENDQAATNDAFDVLHYITAKRLAAGRLTVVDATNVQSESRRPLVALAREYHVILVAIVIQTPEDVCRERNATRPDRDFGSHVIRNQSSQLRRSLKGLQREGFRYVHVLRTPEEVELVTIERQPLWNNRKHDHGPFDIVGDIHGCYDELTELIAALGYVDGKHAQGRKLVFLGDFVDRGPKSVDVLKLVMRLAKDEGAIAVPGNHDVKLVKALRGANVQLTHGLGETMEQLKDEPQEFKQEAASFLNDLVSHYILDDGRLVVAHAGMKAEMQGRGSGKVRDFALYGETTGETDEYGLPIRYNWASDYRGRAMVVYGHTPVLEAEWVNNTINIDTGCVFGGQLTALRYPEKELVSVDAHARYYEPAKPFSNATSTRPDDVLDIADVAGKRILHPRLQSSVTIREENAIAALEVMSRFAVAPQWLIYLPPTMSPSETTTQPGLLEHPAEALDYYRSRGIGRVVCQEKHMGSRAVVIICRDEASASKRFRIQDPGLGTVFTRTGRPFFSQEALHNAFLAHVHKAVDAAGLWDEFQSDWFCIDCELMPWSAKAQELLKNQYAAVGAASLASLSSSLETAKGSPAPADLVERLETRLGDSVKFIDAYRRYCWQVTSIEDYKLAPFHLLACEGKTFVDRDHVWHMETIARICNGPMLLKTPFKVVDLSDDASMREGTMWWEELTGSGGEGMVVKPMEFVGRGIKGVLQPAIKCRGPEYLRIIYGPDYQLPQNLERLRRRGLARKRSLAMREFALGVESLERFVRGEPLYRVHECVFGVLALESEPVDPRL
jgi:protein phosphatase